MAKEYKLVCPKCGYVKQIYAKTEIIENDPCPLCGEFLSLENKNTKESTGDNYPVISGTQEQEITSSIKIVGESATWDTIEKIKDAKQRVSYRMIFLRLGYKPPQI